MKTIKSVLLTVFISLTLLLSGCATLFSDPEDEITFTTDPKGAEVYLNGDLAGKTPFSLKVEREFSKTMIIVIKKKGYKTKEFMLKNTLNTAAIFNLTSAPSWTTDAISGNMMEYDPKKYLITLERTKRNALNEHKHIQQRKALTYIALSFNKLKRDIANGQGEYLTALTEIMPEHGKSEAKFIQKISVNKQQLIETQNPVQMYNMLAKLSNA